MGHLVMGEYVREENGYLFVDRPPKPTEADLVDVHGWIDSWYPHYAEDLWGDPEVGLGEMPPRFAVSLANVPAGLIGTKAWVECVTWLKQALSTRDGLSTAIGLVGPPGTGKTTLMAATCYDITRGLGHRNCMFYDARSLVTWLKAQDQPSYERAARMNIFTRKPVAFIDDLGVESDHDWEKSLITELIETRYAQGHPTWFTSNLIPNQMAERYSGRTIDRLKETTQLIPLSGESNRKRNPQCPHSNHAPSAVASTTLTRSDG